MLHPRAANYSRRALYYFESAGLIVIAVATIYAGYQETMLMVSNARVTLADLLLMFLYLEILTMVGLYFESGKLPVRFPLYIAMVAMARYVIVDIKEMDNIRLLGVSGVDRAYSPGCARHTLWTCALPLSGRPGGSGSLQGRQTPRLKQY